ncbi:GNAT family N-acetyltransferase [Streptomyces solincola]|uniref:GNAT family N-acetyltransferase n=1 Tax=Streptomyces solincola TaxID=2100817 RepID=A0A2S9PRE7_9ACTN|nr:GNAT family N-acetyltransferase [Streptomyces solincola]PRH76998.1 GNAT family N-acetyltransferase [Streptomyces solincola]
MPLLRRARVSDHAALVECVHRWGDGPGAPAEPRDVSLLLPRVFLQSFSGTSLVVEDATGVRAFLVGLHSADHDDRAHIHFVGVDPALRGRGLARGLYAAFFARAAEAGRREVRAATWHRNTGSIAFHQALGFSLDTSESELDGLPVHRDYDGPGHHRVCFRKAIAG